MRKFNKKKMKAMLITLCFATMLVGCGKEKVEYVDDDTSSSEATGILTDTSEDLEDTWKENAIGSNNKIDATVISPDVSEFKAIQVSENFYDEEEKKEFLEGLQAEVIYKYDLNNYTKEMLDALIEECNNQLAIYEVEAQGEEFQYLYDEQYALIAEYEKLKENAPDELVEATEYDCDTYLAKINGVDYIISMGNQGENYNAITIEPTNEYMYVLGKDWEGGFCLFDESLLSESINTNMCTITQAEAEKKAITFVEQLGITDMKMVGSYHAPFNGFDDEGKMEKVYYNGYVMRFSRNIDGVTIDRNEYYSNYCSTADELYIAQCNECYGNMIETHYFDRGYGVENIYVVVNDEGVVYFYYESPLSVDSVMGEDLQLISFDSVKNIMIEEIQDKDYYSNEIFTECKLTYFPVRDEKDRNSIAMVPVWKLSDTNNTTMVVVNAIDGSVINMGYQLYVPYDYGDMFGQ